MNQEVIDCLLCGTPLNYRISWLMLIEKFQPVICERCEKRFELNDKIDEGHTAFYQYNDAMKDYLHRYKFMQDVILARVFSAVIAHYFQQIDAVIVPVPMHRERERERTFAHVEQLLVQAHVPYVQLLEKRSIEQQSKKTREERLQAEPLFRVTAHVEPSAYVVFDDIYTTGTTLTHAKKVLMEAGAKSILSVSLIRG